MSGFETDDYVSDTCEIVKVLNSFGESVATIFRKPNGEFEVQGACLVRNELKQEHVWYNNLRRYRKLRLIVTSSGCVLDIERHGSNGILLINLSLRMSTSGYQLTEVKTVSV
ncbi:hypothetical protein pdam_00018457 [Pocillopora damicornis]|uniref:Uncharacterized protein n=1 Tax=Pocillopora damicornis TaxID=46731 RepID=A0A3M6UBG1_POCDA|nr:hypothetical protein pdam_00018457 [Pocillopora damicornis]